MYHGLVERDLDPFCWHMLAVEKFERQMAWLARRYQVLPLEEALERLDAGTLPARAACLTFDDGYRSNATLAAPILARHGLCATVFLVADHVGTNKLLWPDALYLAIRATKAVACEVDLPNVPRLSLATSAERAVAYATLCRAVKTWPVASWEDRLLQLHAALGEPIRGEEPAFALLDWHEVASLARGSTLSFGPHGATHPIFSQCTDDRLAEEIDRSLARHRTQFGREAACFAYPNGRAIDFDARAIAHLEQRGVRHALSTEPGPALQNSPRHALPRISVGADLGFARFRLLAAGWGGQL